MTVVSPNRIVFDIKIGNAGQLYNSGNFAFNNLGIPNTNLSSTNIDLGLTFFYGKNIVTGMEGTTSNLGSGTYFAF
jgi:hypothetical protein